MTVIQEVESILQNVLQVNQTMSFDTVLLGGIPEFDSMAVVTVLTAIEERYGIMIDDDEVDAAIFETVGTLVSFIEQKI